ncbi:MAG: response regulator, partial [Microbacteriaceae bacterium]|nr:response regulator [Microbacteriaceae bacterium]
HAHAGKFDLVILDLTMPGLDGVGALKQIRELASRTCVLLMSGYTDREPALAALLNDTTLFLRKPFTREQLMEKAAALLARDAAAISSK